MLSANSDEILQMSDEEDVMKLLKKSCTAPLDKTDRRRISFGLAMSQWLVVTHSPHCSASTDGPTCIKPCSSEPLGRGRLRKAVGSVIFSNYWRPVARSEDAGNLLNHDHQEHEVTLRPPQRSNWAAAEIAFDGGTSPYCLISHSSHPEDLFDCVILPEWGLRTPNLILSIMGGAGNMKPSEKFDIVCFSKGLVEAATRTCAWVITGGTASGVMDIVGKAMQKHDKQRQVPCIGISPFGALTSKWRGLLEKQTEDTPIKQMKVDAAEAQSQSPEKEGKITLAALQDNHSHFIICDNGEVGSKTFGSEIPFRTRFEDYVAKGSMPGSTKAPVPRVMILVNGGKISLDSLVQAIRTGCPLVVCQGTGRIADVICSILDVTKNRPDSDSESSTPSVGEDEEFALLLQSAVKEFMGNEPLTQEDVANAREIVSSGKVEIYSINDRLEDVILRAVLGNSRSLTSPVSNHTGVWQQLALAVQWGCKDYYDDLGRRLIQDKGGHEHGGPQEAIRLIFQELVAFGWRNNKGDAKTFKRQRKAAKTPINVVKNVRENTGPLVAWLLQHFLKQMDQFEVSEHTFGATTGKIHWNRLGQQESWKSLEGLLLWSIEQEAPSSLLEIIWSYMEDPVHAALVAASVFRDTAEREHGFASYHDCLAKKELDDAADRFERLAVLVVEDLALTGKGVDYLFQESMRWQVSGQGGQGRTCFKLAHELGCKMFVSATFYRLAVDLYWITPVPFHITKDKLDTKEVSWWALLSLLWNFQIGGFTLWEFLSIPSSQAWTHGISRSVFVGLYSYAVFKRLLTFGGISTVEVLLFFWGFGFGLVEINQLHSMGFQAYIHDFWNFLDALHITVLLGALVLGVALADKNEDINEVEHILEITHAMNLLPCWIRVLQILQLSEYFGTLLITIFGMAKDALKFFILVVIFCFGFSCAITPILFPNGLERDEQGLTWAFWTIVGNLDDKALNKLSSLESGTRFIAVVLVYTLALVCNVLLVNLLIAVMNSTYEKNQAVSQTQWAYNRVEAVLEFDHESILPPPLNLLGLLKTPFFSFFWPFFFKRSRADSIEEEAALAGDGRVDVSVTRRDLKDAQQRAFKAITYEEDRGESAMLRAELAELRLRNTQLDQRNKDLEALAANFLLERNAAVVVSPETPFNHPPSPQPGSGAARKNRRLPTGPLTYSVLTSGDKSPIRSRAP
ncbi:unnamed protein product [Durusdinium trenchii]|uniref:Transient receptor potential cation channel subfamily M member 2 n=1 Tax=Durusdinium trenchii TaxID=1381693 RepID=A0ABP0RX68_9DINO